MQYGIAGCRSKRRLQGRFARAGRACAHLPAPTPVAHPEAQRLASRPGQTLPYISIQPSSTACKARLRAPAVPAHMSPRSPLQPTRRRSGLRRASAVRRLIYQLNFSWLGAVCLGAVGPGGGCQGVLKQLRQERPQDVGNASGREKLKFRRVHALPRQVQALGAREGARRKHAQAASSPGAADGRSRSVRGSIGAISDD